MAGMQILTIHAADLAYVLFVKHLILLQDHRSWNHHPENERLWKIWRL